VTSPVPDEVREALVDAVLSGNHWFTSDGALVDAQEAVDTVLSHLEQVGMVSDPPDFNRPVPVYRIRKDAP
jgi:hypothetical protein